jgi:tetratricopeptide (TPR) repeat protein
MSCYPRITFRLALLALLAASPAAAQSPSPAPPDTATNLKVLPVGTPRHEVVRIMRGYARALGVECQYCHVGDERRPPKPQDFALDDKPTKDRAREMMRMVEDINHTYLARLDKRSEPPVGVECATCHRGVAQPRMLRDVLKTAYIAGGIDSALASYRALRERYYGAAAYDFGDGTLVDLAGSVRTDGHAHDALRLLAYNVQVNPSSVWAKRQHATGMILDAFTSGGVDDGGGTYRAMRQTYGDTLTYDGILGDVGRQLITAGRTDAGMAALALAVAEFPRSVRALVNLGDALARKGDAEQAQAAYDKAARIDPNDPMVRQRTGAPGARR